MNYLGHGLESSCVIINHNKYVTLDSWSRLWVILLKCTVSSGPGGLLLGRGFSSFPFQGLRCCQNGSLDILAPLGFNFYPELSVSPSGGLDSYHKVVGLFIIQDLKPLT